MKRRFMKTVLPVCLATSMCMTGAITSSAEEGEDIVLKFTYKQNASNDPLEAWLTEKNIIGQFEEQHPGVKIELSPISSTEGDYATLLALQLSYQHCTGCLHGRYLYDGYRCSIWLSGMPR